MAEMTDEDWELLDTVISCPVCGINDTDALRNICFSCKCKERGCTIVQSGPFRNRHYHCGHCNSPEATSYQGHYGSKDGITWTFSCEESNGEVP